MSNAVASDVADAGRATATPAADRAVDCEVEPEHPSVDQAHKMMQTHLRCPTETCRHRKIALAVLVDAGRYVLP